MTLAKVKSLSTLIENLNFKYQLLDLQILPRRVKTKAKPQTIPKELQTDFEKTQKTNFSNPNIVKNDPYKSHK